MTGVLAVLAILGKILLCLLLVVLILLALLLFFPFSYRMHLVKTPDAYAVDGTVGWLFRLIHADLHAATGEKPQSDVRICGIPVLSVLQHRKERKKQKAEKKAAAQGRKTRPAAPVRPRVRPGEKRSSAARVGQIEIIQTKRPSRLERLAARIQALVGKVRSLYRKCRKTGDRIASWIEYLQSPSFARVKTVLLKEGRGLLRALLPRKLQGRILFGTEDPAVTGEILGVYAMFAPLLPKGLSVDADFLNATLEADIRSSGRIHLIQVVYHAVRILLTKEIRALLGRIRNSNRPPANKEMREKTWQTTKNTMHFKTT